MRVQFYFIFIFLLDPSWSESIRVDPTQTGGPSWSGPTFVPACFVMFYFPVFLLFFFGGGGGGGGYIFLEATKHSVPKTQNSYFWGFFLKWKLDKNMFQKDFL